MDFLKAKTLSLIPINYFSLNNKNEDETDSTFKSGVIRDRFTTFSEYRNNFKIRFYHFFEKDIFKESESALENSTIFRDPDDKKIRLLPQPNIELKNLKEINSNDNYIDLFHNTEILRRSRINKR